MTDVSKRNRQPAGAKTGGQFAPETGGKNAPDTAPPLPEGAIVGVSPSKRQQGASITSERFIKGNCAECGRESACLRRKNGLCAVCSGRQKPVRILMRCGHVTNGTIGDQDLCITCSRENPLREQVWENPPSLEGRQAECVCGSREDSSVTLPFFEYHGEDSPQGTAQYDGYYCGHRGWD